MSKLTAKRGRKRPASGAEQVGDLLGEVSEVFGVEGGDVSQEHSQFSEVFGASGIGGDACGGGGEIEGGLVVEEVERGVEVAVEEAKLGFVAFGVAFHFGLEGWEAQLLCGSSRSCERFCCEVA